MSQEPLKPVFIGKQKVQYLFVRDGRFVVRCRKRNLDKKVLRAKTPRAAVEEMDDLFAKVDGLSARPSGLVRISETGEEVIAAREAMRPGTSYHTARYIRRDLIPWFEKHCPYWAKFDETVWESFVKDRQAKGLKVYSCRMHFSKLMNRAFHQGHIGRKFKLKNPDAKADAGRCLSDREIDRLRAAAKAAGLRAEAFFTLGLDNGMRKAEVRRLEWSDVNLITGDIIVHASKAKIKKSRTFRSHPRALALLKELEATRTTNPFVFPSRLSGLKKEIPIESFEGPWKAIKKAAKVKCRFHDLRHTRITHALLCDKIHPPLVALYFGVSLDVIYRVYLHGSAEFTAEVAGKSQG